MGCANAIFFFFADFTRSSPSFLQLIVRRIFGHNPSAGPMDITGMHAAAAVADALVGACTDG